MEDFPQPVGDQANQPTNPVDLWVPAPGAEVHNLGDVALGVRYGAGADEAKQEIGKGVYLLVSQNSAGSTTLSAEAWPHLGYKIATRVVNPETGRMEWQEAVEPPSDGRSYPKATAVIDSDDGRKDDAGYVQGQTRGNPGVRSGVLRITDSTTGAEQVIMATATFGVGGSADNWKVTDWRYVDAVRYSTNSDSAVPAES